jgi:hypothetical protein
VKLMLSHVQVLDVGSGTVQERSVACLLVGDGKRVLETTVAIPKLIASLLCSDLICWRRIPLRRLRRIDKKLTIVYNKRMTYTSFGAVAALAGVKSSSSSKSPWLPGRCLRSQPERATDETLMGS